ncbi:hypothetical protein [Sphingomonas crusticola]|nr:hypothetical protein [Sphingomonas crusticola]
MVDVTRNLIRAADALAEQRRQTDRIVAALEERWAANRLLASGAATEDAT